MFKDRADAGRRLAERLEQYQNTESVVLALPRGGVVVGQKIARRLSLPLDILAVRKIGHPSNPEYAIGSVDETGLISLDESEVSTIDKQTLDREIGEQKEEARRRSSLYRNGRKPLALEGRNVILVDDGIATGFTMRLAIRSARRQEAGKIIVAVPVAPKESLHELKIEGADEIIVLESPETFMGAVGSHYRKFEQVEDEEVIRLLKK